MKTKGFQNKSRPARPQSAKPKMPIRHIGILSAICGRDIRTSLNEDLGFKRYKQLGRRERFKDEKPYRICGNCLAVIHKRETTPFWRWKERKRK